MQAIAEGAGRPTHIMYRCSLSWTVMQNLLRTLEQQGLITRSDYDGKKNYLLTEKGKRVLRTYMSVSQFLAPVPLSSTASSIRKPR
jgi:predicted transcriptional regulator